MNGLTFRIALSAACAGGDHDRCAGRVGPDAATSVPCACLHHRTDVADQLDVDAAGMLSERLAEVGCIEALERVRAFVDEHLPGRPADVDLVEWMQQRELVEWTGDAVDDTAFVRLVLIGDGRFVGIVDWGYVEPVDVVPPELVPEGGYVEVHRAVARAAVTTPR